MSKLYGAERVAQIRAKLKEKYPYIKFSITKDGYNGVNIRILEAPIDFSDKENQKAKEALEDIENIASEGVTYRETGDYGNQPDFYVWVRVGTYDKPFVYKPSSSPTTSVDGTRKPFTRGTSTTNYDRGMLVFECDSGWKVYKKTLPDNRVVYNAIKDKDVASNKDDWNAIKGEVYIEAGFKWGRFGAFERWGIIASESYVLTKLCAVFSKYYKKTNQDTPTTQTPAPTASPTPQPTQPEPEQQQFVDVDTSIPPNPKLEYCEIVWAEGSDGYSSLFPKKFTSFTQLTKYIADNIGELPTLGYDKHKVRWKWNDISEPMEERWDISERGANPFKYPNLFASEVLKGLCYDAWKKGDSVDRISFETTDYVLAVTIGKEGFELSNSQFNIIMNECLTLYPSDNKRFDYNNETERLERLFTVYPRLYRLFNTPQQPQGDVEQETRNLLRSLELIRGDGTNQEIEQLIRALRLILN